MSEQEPDKQQKLQQQLQLMRQVVLEWLERSQQRDRPEWEQLREWIQQPELRQALEQLQLREWLRRPENRELEGLYELIRQRTTSERFAELLAFSRKVAKGIVLAEQASELESSAPISLYFDLDNFSTTDIVDIIALFSELYMDVGGDGLIIDDVTLLDCQPALNPVEV